MDSYPNQPDPTSKKRYQQKFYLGGFQGPERPAARSFRITFNRFKHQLTRFQKLQEEDSMAQVPWGWGLFLGEGRPPKRQGLESLGFRLQRLSLLEEVSPGGPRGALQE